MYLKRYFRRAGRSRNHRVWWWWCLALVLAAATSVSSQSGSLLKAGEIGGESIKSASSTLRESIEQAVRENGGDLEREHLHLIIGFSTGHFSSDPNPAKAARAIASSLVSELLVKGDRLSVFAWEMGLWDPQGSRRNPITVSEDRGPDKDRLQDLWPLKPQSRNSRGHDTERAISEITLRIGGANDAVIVLLTREAASMDAPDERASGANDAGYQAIQPLWRRLPQVNESGASVVLPYTVAHPNGDLRNQNLDAVVVVPRRFASAQLSDGTRSERLAVSPLPATVAPAPFVPPAVNWPLIFFVIGLACVGMVIAYVLIRSKGPRAWTMEVSGQPFDLSSVKPGEEVCHLAGSGYSQSNNRTVFLLDSEEAPPVRIARFVRERSHVRVVSDKLRLHSVSGVTVDGAGILRGEGEYQLVFRGEYVPDPMMPPQNVQIEVGARIVPAG